MILCVLVAAVAACAAMVAVGQPAGGPAKADSQANRAREFHLRAQQPSGLLVPLYVYPGNVANNPAFQRLIDLKRQYETVPVWVIVNPASGPGKKVDPNYTRAIDRLVGAGCVVIGYVTTSYAKRPAADVRADVDGWRTMYPRVHGIFFDEMVYEDTDAAVRYQAGLNAYAHEAGCWPTVANPGADTPGRYFAGDAAAADVIVVHEGDAWPAEDRLKGEQPGGYADHPPHTRAVLVHSTARLDPAALRTARKYARWFYVTEAPFRANDPAAANPWDRLSSHAEALCEQLSKQP
jgi:hypothetical protein